MTDTAERLVGTWRLERWLSQAEGIQRQESRSMIGVRISAIATAAEQNRSVIRSAPMPATPSDQWPAEGSPSQSFRIAIRSPSVNSLRAFEANRRAPNASIFPAVLKD